jgi:hypothetical protein
LSNVIDSLFSNVVYHITTTGYCETSSSQELAIAPVQQLP